MTERIERERKTLEVVWKCACGYEHKTEPAATVCAKQHGALSFPVDGKRVFVWGQGKDLGVVIAIRTQGDCVLVELQGGERVFVPLYELSDRKFSGE